MPVEPYPLKKFSASDTGNIIYKIHKKCKKELIIHAFSKPQVTVHRYLMRDRCAILGNISVMQLRDV
jgi:hypothetical protein